MKKIFLSLFVAVIATTAIAQSTVATLTHGGQISMFYGAKAFHDAYTAAESGDVINLSGGTFQSTKITKAVTVRGTGVDDANPTIITGYFEINIPSEVSERLSFEGCRLTGQISVCGANNYCFYKNSINSINYYTYYFNDNNDYIEAGSTNGSLINCQIYSMSFGGDSNSKVQLINSHVENFSNYDVYGGDTGSATFINCVIIPFEGYRADYISSSELINSILVYLDYSSYYYHRQELPETTSALNCISVGDERAREFAFSSIESALNCNVAGIDIFQDSDHWKDLTDNAKAKYLGTDDTPIGMYGGVLPYSMIPSYPRITKMNVANKTTVDGKLSVEIEVSAED